MASRIYNLCANHTSNLGFDRTFINKCSAQAIFMRCRTTSGVPYIVGLTYVTARSKTVRESVGLPIARGKLVCEFNFHLTDSIIVVQSIETPPNLHQTTQNHYRIYSQYHIMCNFFLGHSRPLRGGDTCPQAPPPPRVRHWLCARIHTVVGLKDRQLFRKANLKVVVSTCAITSI